MTKPKRVFVEGVVHQTCMRFAGGERVFDEE
jgi:hypothetical protein